MQEAVLSFVEEKEEEEYKMAKITLLRKEKNLDEISFIVRGINNRHANALRRSVSEIPILAIDTVEFIKNDSALYDEFIAHRLGLIPLKTDKSFTFQEDCGCEGKGCLKCTATLKFAVKGPCTVFSKELKSKSVEPVYEDIPIVILDKDQELEVVATAKLGKAIEHAKFSPGLVWFRSLPIIEMGNLQICENCSQNLPKNILDFEDKKLLFEELSRKNLCKSCQEALKKNNKELKIFPSETDFIFTIESWGQIPAKEIFIEACKVLEENLEKTSKDLEKSK